MQGTINHQIGSLEGISIPEPIHGATLPSAIGVPSQNGKDEPQLLPLEERQIWREVAERLEKGLPYKRDRKCPLHSSYRARWLQGDWYLCRSPACSFAFRNSVVESPEVEW